MHDGESNEDVKKKKDKRRGVGKARSDEKGTRCRVDPE